MEGQFLGSDNFPHQSASEHAPSGTPQSTSKTLPQKPRGAYGSSRSPSDSVDSEFSGIDLMGLFDPHL